MLRGTIISEQLIETNPKPQVPPLAEPRQSQENVESEYPEFKTIPLTSPIQRQENQIQEQTTINDDVYCHTAPIPPIYKPVRFPLLERVHNSPPQMVTTSPTNYSSSFFDIETSASQETQIPYSDIELSILSPHQPPYEPSPSSSSDHAIRTRLERQSLFPQVDMFVEYTEERYRRFRPSESQHNNEIIIQGNHPYQLEKYTSGATKPESSFLNIFTSWRKKSQPQPDLENQLGQVSEESSSSPSNIIKNLKPNSSRSIILPSPTTIINEPNLTSIPLYTPKAIPINEFPLNFEKLPGQDDITRNQIINSLDDEVRYLIDGVDNFIIECFDGLWSILVSIGDFFVTLY